MFGFLRTILGLVPETVSVSFRTLAFFFPLVTNYLVLRLRHSFPFDSEPLPLIQFSHSWRQIFAIGVSDLCFSSPQSSTSAFWASVFFDENFHLVQNSNDVELIRLSYFQFVQTFQDVIRWNL